MKLLLNENLDVLVKLVPQVLALLAQPGLAGGVHVVQITATS